MMFACEPEETSELVAIARRTAVFKPHELEALGEVLTDYHDINHTFGHEAWSLRQGLQTRGFVYFAPTAMTDRTWELWWIAVDPAYQGQGLGRALLEFVESRVRAAGGRLLLIETSSTPLYEPTRAFYLKEGYASVACIPDFYADGDGKSIFSKRIAPVLS